ncbi:MAG: uridine kinase [Oscillospiraceae bacterium]|nr:uridine kinase [Oscillospiraceae bacterium]
MEKIVSAVLRKIESSEKNRLLIAVDGRCASGKTTFAKTLQKQIGCTVIHTDHFFLRPEQRTEQRFNEAGGNMDYERLKEEVMLPLSEGKHFSYRKFDCEKMELSSEIDVSSSPVTVVEGSYSCHPALWEFYDLRIFFTVEPQEQLRRIQIRNGSETAVRFRDRWIPLEEKYFDVYKIQERCDFVFHT